MQPQYKIKESFRWLAPEAFKVQSVGKNTVKVRGVALKANSISKNNRKYVREELEKAARTWIGTPVTINHNDRRIVGHVDWMEFEDPLLEYLMTIKKQPYVSMFRNHDSRIQGVSVQADYLYNRCYKCGERFYDAESYRKHMTTEHLIKDVMEEPHGIKGTRLSVVVEPEVPGVQGTTTELWETLHIAQDGGLQLLETVTTDKKQKIEWKRTHMKKTRKIAALTEDTKIAISRTKVKEQDEDIKPGSHYCEEHPDDPRCKEHKKAIHGDASEQDEHGCGPDEEWDGEKCVKKATEQDEHGCGEDEHWDGEKCVPNETTEETEQGTPELTEPPAEPPVVQGLPVPPTEEEEESTPEIPTVKIEVPKIEGVPVPVKTEVTGPIIEQEVATSTDTESPVHSTLPVTAFPTLEPPSPPELTKQCEEDSHWDEIAGTCVPDAPTPSRVVSAEPVAIEYPSSDVTVEFKLPKLKLGEPFAGYTDFADCVAKNQDKDDPDAYCADIKRKTEGETATESTGNLYTLLSEQDRKSYVRDAKNAEAINQLGEAQALLLKKLDAIPSIVHKQLLKESKLRGVGDKRTLDYLKTLPSAIQKGDKTVADWTHKLVTETVAQSNKQIASFMQNYITETVKQAAEIIMKYNRDHVSATTKQAAKTIMEYNQKYVGASVKKAAETIMKYNRDLTRHTNETVASSLRSLGQRSHANDVKILEYAKKINETRIKDKGDFEKLLSIADENMDSAKDHIKTLEERIKEQEEHQCGENEHWSDEEQKCVPNEEPEQVAELRKKIEELEKNKLKETEDLTTRVQTLEDNQRASQRGKFKSETPADKTSTASYEDGLTPKKTKK